MLASTAGLLLATAAGCGMVAAPQPPSLKLPEPVDNLTAQRVGNEVDLRWTMPKRTTDNLLLAGGQTAQICRQVADGPCSAVGHIIVAPQAVATFTDTLPAGLLSGPRRQLTYVVALENHAGRSAGPSNRAMTVTGIAPPQVLNLLARAEADGIVLSWNPMGSEGSVRIHRVLAGNTPGHKPIRPKAAVPAEQTLEFTGNAEGRVLDPDAALDHVYTYTVQRVEKVAVEGRSVEVDGTPSESVTIDARDIFPPAVPRGLQAVADPEAHAIDLSWQPDTDADLAGYIVYRREEGSSAAPVRISGTAEPVPSFRDTKVEPGHTYCYSVSAVDRDGNASARSAEVDEGLPSQ